MANVKWIVGLGIAVDRGLGCEGVWYTESCIVEAPPDENAEILEMLAYSVITNELDARSKEQIRHTWLDFYEIDDEDDSFFENEED